MSVEDVERELEKYRQGFAKSIINITPNEIPEQSAESGPEEPGSGTLETLEGGFEEDEDPQD
jgi:hypothetical protein